MPGFLGGAQNAQPKQPFGPQLKQALISAAPLFSSMAAGYSSGRGPYAYLDQGIAGMQDLQKQKRDAESAAAAAAAFGGLVPGGMGPAMSTKGGGSGGTFWEPGGKLPAADVGAIGATGGFSFPGQPKADVGAYGAQGGLSFHAPSAAPEGWDAIRNGIFAGESGGDYDALFGFSNRDGGQFSNVKLTDMTVDQALQFASPSGPYGQWVKGQVGRVATPMGAYQIVGTTLQAAKEGLGLTGNEKMTPELQEKLGQWIYAQQGTGAWEGYRGPQAAPEGGWGGGSVTMSAKGETGPVDPLADPYVQRLMQVMAMPGLTPERRSVVELQLQTRMGQLTATAKTEALPAGFRELDLQAQAGGLVPGTPEYQNFMLSGGAGATGGEGPAAFQALHMQALAAGFTEGSPEYQNFMATRGAGLVAESKALGDAKGSAIAGAPAEIAAADETLGFIDEVRNHPGLDAGTGMSSMFNVVPGTPGYDFQNRVNQLLSGGFLTAIDQLRGMGALSNAEGQTATRAISRMDTATSKEEFLAALDDYERVVQQGRERAAGKLTEAPPSGAVSAPSTNDLGLSDDDLQYLGQP